MSFVYLSLACHFTKLVMRNIQQGQKKWTKEKKKKHYRLVCEKFLPRPQIDLSLEASALCHGEKKFLKKSCYKLSALLESRLFVEKSVARI